MEDEMRIRSSIMTRILSKIIERFLKKKFGVDCDVLISEIIFKNNGVKTSVRATISTAINTNDISKVTDKFFAS